jgi:hypothetical protein
MELSGSLTLGKTIIVPQRHAHMERAGALLLLNAQEQETTTQKTSRPLRKTAAVLLVIAELGAHGTHGERAPDAALKSNLEVDFC